MKRRSAILFCLCLVGLAQLVWSQNRAARVSHEKGIPGYLDPRTGKFTTRVDDSALNAAKPELTGTTILFREQFNITITNYDQSSSDAVACEATIDSDDDPNGDFYEDAMVFATRSGSTYTCDVPILAQWTLQTPGSDTIYAYVYVDFLKGVTIGPASTYFEVRESDQPRFALPVPSNGQTVVTNLGFIM